MFIKELKRAGLNPTQAGLIEAIESFKDFETGLTSSTTFAPGVREGNQSAKIFETQKDRHRKLLPMVVRATEGESKR